MHLLSEPRISLSRRSFALSRLTSICQKWRSKEGIYHPWQCVLFHKWSILPCSWQAAMSTTVLLKHWCLIQWSILLLMKCLAISHTCFFLWSTVLRFVYLERYCAWQTGLFSRKSEWGSTSFWNLDEILSFLFMKAYRSAGQPWSVSFCIGG